MARRIYTFLTLAILGASCGCSSADEGSKVGSGSNGNGNGNGNSGQGGEFFGGNGTGSTGSGSDFEACATESAATEAAPLDIYIMFDQSCSMSCPSELSGPGLCCPGEPRPRIDQVRAAVGSFLNAPESAGIGVGIGYFGYFPTGATSCNPNDYEDADVQIGMLPDQANAIMQSLNRAQPTGETPTGAAIRGACRYARGWKEQNPGHSVVILLVTDGVPEAPVSMFSCRPSLEDAEEAASECNSPSGGPAIPTYVLGVGANLENLSRLAVAGGTSAAYLAGGGTDVTQSVLDALNQIRDGAAVPCDFQVPPPPSGEELDPTKVNVTYLDARGQEQLVRSAGTVDLCGDEGGWYYDDPLAPSLVRLCPTTCNRVTAALIAGSVLGRPARIDLKYGCGTVSVVE